MLSEGSVWCLTKAVEHFDAHICLSLAVDRAGMYVFFLLKHYRHAELEDTSRSLAHGFSSKANHLINMIRRLQATLSTVRQSPTANTRLGSSFAPSKSSRISYVPPGIVESVVDVKNPKSM